MTDERILKTLRSQSWERAKGELKAVLQTFWPNNVDGDEYSKMSDAVKQFISNVEDNGLTQ